MLVPSSDLFQSNNALHNRLLSFQYICTATEPIYLHFQQVYGKQHGSGQGFNFVPVLVIEDNAAPFAVEFQDGVFTINTDTMHHGGIQDAVHKLTPSCTYRNVGAHSA